MNDLHEALRNIDEPMKRFPLINEGLIVALEVAFEPKPPSPATNERDDLYHAGQQAVIAKLREVWEWQRTPQPVVQ